MVFKNLCKKQWKQLIFKCHVQTFENEKQNKNKVTNNLVLKVTKWTKKTFSQTKQCLIPLNNATKNAVSQNISKVGKSTSLISDMLL